MKRKDTSSKPTISNGKYADGGRGLIEVWLNRFFPVWSDMPPYDRTSPHYSRTAQPGSAVKR
jgi:hypothetical protein